MTIEFTHRYTDFGVRVHCPGDITDLPDIDALNLIHYGFAIPHKTEPRKEQAVTKKQKHKETR